MPELKLKDIRLPVLRLPEMSRDDIAKALGEARKEMIEVRRDLKEFRRDFEMPKIEMPAVDMPSMDDARAIVDDARKAARDARKGAKDAGRKMTKEVKSAAQDAGIVQRSSRVPFVLAGLVTLGLVAWALLNSPRIKERIRVGAEQAKARMAERRDHERDDDTHAFDAAERAGVDPSPFDDAIPATDSPFMEPPTDLPKGLGKTNGNRTMAPDEATHA
ncbi:MAG: hypothetical protein ACXW4L_09110 [Candidatus Limnocylindrales bacterium]